MPCPSGEAFHNHRDGCQCGQRRPLCTSVCLPLFPPWMNQMSKVLSQVSLGGSVGIDYIELLCYGDVVLETPTVKLGRGFRERRVPDARSRECLAGGGLVLLQGPE